VRGCGAGWRVAQRGHRPGWAADASFPLSLSAARADAVSFLSSCAHPGGGYGGGPGQAPHLAPTYAAVAALVTLGGGEALSSIDRESLRAFLFASVNPPPSSGFRVCDGGESDVRGAYTALAAASLAGLDAGALARAARLPVFLSACATPSGGLGGAPGNEAHGGYAYCGAAAAALAERAGARFDPPAFDRRRLACWAARLQHPSLAGFAGRPNKLVDGCYSFWVGGLWPAVVVGGGGLPSPRATARLPPGTPPLPPLPPVPVGGIPGPVERARRAAAAAASAAASAAAAAATGGAAGATLDAAAAAADADEWASLAADVADAGAALLASPPTPTPSTPTGHDAAALQHWLLACCQSPGGGMRDKPGKAADHYHTCYCLSGLSLAQAATAPAIVGGAANAVAAIDPLLNVVVERAAAAAAWFAAREEEERGAAA